MGRNLKITLAYDGSEFYGWQVQPNLKTVQGTLADCLKRLTGEDVLPQGSGRTDAGVHALAQVASVQLQSSIPERNFVVALNDLLPPSIRVTAVNAMRNGFHARHSATAKTYTYRIYRGDICPPFLARYDYHDPYPMNEEALMRASEHVVGKHDFTSFAASDPDRSARLAELEDGETSRFGSSGNVRTIHSSQWVRTEEELIYTVRGDGFLHHMVRNLVGTFLLVGKGSLKIADVPAILEARNRSAAGPTAAACGLYLVSVEYQEKPDHGDRRE
jgi:tRNA pseudouridine38-40 synthase